MLDKKLLAELKEYVESHLKDRFILSYSKVEYCLNKQYSEELLSSELEDFITHYRKPTFAQVLFDFIDQRGAKDSDIYKKAGIDRRHFAKIRANPAYHPNKNTTIALGLALELNEEEMDELLTAAGYSLSDSNTFDLVIKFCIDREIYNLLSVNEALDYFSLKPLCG